ncbi:Aromatic peroxygenase [Lecanosticta acicola]|uniref:Aromatic peroxygenase n=1 Tax=Lecanosticta acicola TaxID=111012 RepID=A0AAI8YY12_9PEZI|nr:Aromatic peroxygenase [Lecanosticta acicola]
MKGFLSLLALPALATAFPSLKEAGNEKRLLRQVGNLANDVQGLLGSIATSVDPENRRPEPGYHFREPRPNDSRGACPGLNLLANYGYLPRDGYVNFGQVVEAVARGFNMGADLAVVLCVFAVLTDGDIENESWYLGSGPGRIGGLNRHSTVEADISPNKEDYYNGCGDNHHISSRMFRQNVEYVMQDRNKEFSYDVMARHYGENSRFSQQYNPYLYYFPFPSIVSVVAFNFYPEYFSNGSHGAGGVANYESISSIVGARFDEETGNFQYVPERWPENWYRRARPYGAVEALTDGFTRIYPANPVGMPIGQFGTPNFNARTILCDVYQGLNSPMPLFLAGESEATEAQISWALGKLAGVGLSETVLGCPRRTLSANYLYPNASTAGGPLGPPPAEAFNAGNNIYYRSYFCEAPTRPQCDHVC